MTRFSLKSFMSLSLLILSIYSNSAFAKNQIFVYANDEYIVSQEGENVLAFYNGDSSIILKRKFDFSIDKIEICPAYPFLSLTGHSPSNEQTRISCIYDIEQDRLYGDGLFLDFDEKRWSSCGKYTYFNHVTSFAIVETSKLRDYLAATNKIAIVEISGHPLGSIWQVFWEGRYLVYGSGLGEMVCWGLFDTEKNANYFLSCCGIKIIANYSHQCEKSAVEPQNALESLLSILEMNKQKKVTNNFYGDVLEIINK